MGVLGGGGVGETLFRISYFRDFSVAYALISLIFDPLKLPGYKLSFDMQEDCECY